MNRHCIVPYINMPIRFNYECIITFLFQNLALQCADGMSPLIPYTGLDWYMIKNTFCWISVMSIAYYMSKTDMFYYSCTCSYLQANSIQNLTFLAVLTLCETKNFGTVNCHFSKQSFLCTSHTSYAIAILDNWLNRLKTRLYVSVVLIRCNGSKYGVTDILGKF